MKKLMVVLPLVVVCCFLCMGVNSCDDKASTTSARSGVGIASSKVQPQTNGLTIEQENVKRRLELENNPGAIQHLYVISAYSGQCILYSTVKGKVTSSGKRLSPSQHAWCGQNSGEYYPELLGDDGTYGNSIDYLYWWDIQGRYHQHYVQGGTIVHISDQPIPVKSVTINMEIKEISQ